MLVATDGYRLHAEPFPDYRGAQQPLLLPTRAADAWRAAKRDGWECVHMGDRLRMRSRDRELDCRLLDDTFPQWRRVVPKPGSELGRATVQHAPLLQALRALRPFGRVVELSTGPANILTLRVKTELGGEYLRAIPGACIQGAAFTRRYDLDYLIDALATLDPKGAVTLVLNDPLTIWQADSESVRLLMPRTQQPSN
jgi:DNA polymerase III sliding clamp (beta) subunit (PCNA family)